MNDSYSPNNRVEIDLAINSNAVRIRRVKIGGEDDVTEVDISTKVEEVLNKLVADNARKSAALIFLGKKLSEELMLIEVEDLKPGYTLQLMLSRPEEVAIVDFNKLKMCRRMLGQLAVRRDDQIFPPHYLHMKVMNRRDLADIIIERFPSIIDDPLSLTIALDIPLTLCYFSSKVDDDFFVQHPRLVDAVHHILFFLMKNELFPEELAKLDFHEAFPTAIDAFQENDTYIELLRGYGYIDESDPFSQIIEFVPPSDVVEEDVTALYSEQNRLLMEFGFDDQERNFRILKCADGNIETALEMIVLELQNE